MIEHPEIEELMAYPLGELTVERSRQVWQHCSACSSCGDELAAIIVLRSSAVEERMAERSGGGWRYLAVAASILLVVGVGWVAQRTLSGTSRDQSAVAGATAPLSDLAALATRETLPQAHLDFHFGAIPAATNRGRVRDGVQAIVERRYEEAARLLRALMLERPSEESAVYLGIALYLQGDHSDEVANLLRAADPARGSLGRAGHWYLANLFVARGEIDAARPILDRLGAREGTDRWGRRAQELVEKLDGF